MLNLTSHSALINSPVRRLQARVEMYNNADSALAGTYNYTDSLVSFSVARVGEGKFFGFGICQKVNIKLRDIKREIEVSTANHFKVQFGVDGTYTTMFPTFYVTEVNRDETTGELSITGYDLLQKAALHTVEELGFLHTTQTGERYSDAYTVRRFAIACGDAIGAYTTDSTIIYTPGVDDESFDFEYTTGANFDGTENIREALNAVAEATQTVYYLNNRDCLVFKRLDKDGTAALNITKSEYFTLKSKTNRRLATIVHTTELGDNLSVSTTVTGSTQFVRDNPFWNILEDASPRLDLALAAVGGLSINQFECQWRGNYLLEIGDKIAITQLDDDSCASFLLDDTIEYDGSMLQKTKWSYKDNDEETATNPTNLGDAVKETYAKVDKINREINLVSSEVAEYDERISKVEVTTDSVQTSVSRVEKELRDTTDGIREELEVLTSKVNQTITADDLTIQIQQELANGVNSVTTETGFTFDSAGLTVSKSGSEMETLITEDGMTVYRDDEAVLTANNLGVQATNLHATTYLIIGTYSRFEDYNKDGESRTGCFWIGEG